jgi:DNA-binding SARP family transcriptional activator/uncharacterized protein HemY
MEFRLLGPVEVCAEDGVLPVPGGKPRALLAALLLEPGRVMSADRLVDLLWEDDPPDTARALVQTHVSALRRVAGGRLAGVVLTRPPGYLAQVPAGSLDWRTFEELVAQGRAAAARGEHQPAAAALRQAENLWRGPALDGLTGNAFAAAAARLHELRIGALEDRVAADLALGRHAELAGELTVLVEQHPTRERLRAQLMLTLYGMGRATEALAVYRHGRERLIEELGMEPGRELARLHDAILRADPDLPRAVFFEPVQGGELPAGGTEPPVGDESPRDRAVVPAQLPADLADFTGRTGPCAELAGALVEPRVCVIAGPGGVGKSALAVHVAHRVAGEFPDGQLHVELRGLSDLPASPVEVLGRFLRALQADGGPLPDSLDERMDRFRTAIADRRILLVLDDATSEAQVRPLLPGGSSCAVLITSRSRLPGLAGAHLVELDTMSPDEATALLANVAGEQRIREAPHAAAQIVDRCGYLPLAVRIAGARLAARRQWSAQLLATRLADEQRRLDELQVGDQRLRATIELSYRALPPPAQVALRRLGWLGYVDFAPWVVAALTGTTVTSSTDVAEQLVDAHLVDYSRVDDAGRVRYRMHDLVRIYAAEQAAAVEDHADRVAAMTSVIGGWLWLVERLAAELPPATLPHAPRGSAAVARPIDPDAAEQAVADPQGWLAMEQHSLVLTVEQAATLGLHEAAVQLASALCGSLFPTYNLLDCWERTHDAAMAAACQAEDTGGKAILLAELGQLRYEQDRFAEARQYLSQALAMFRDAQDARGEAVVLTALGLACREQGYLPEAHHFLDQAATVSAALGDDRAIGNCARIRGSVHLEQGHYAEAWTDLDTALAAYTRAGSRRGEALTLRTIGLVHRATGDLDAAEQAFQSALEILDRIGDRLLAAYCVRALAKTWLRQGHHEKSLAALAEALATCRAAADRWGQALTLRTLGEAYLETGRLDPAGEAFAESLGLWADLETPLQRARTLRDLADLHRARGEVEAGERMRAEAIGLFRVHGAREYRELTEDL